MQVNDKVKPAPTFNFDLYSGPETLDSQGTVTEVFDGYVMVEWETGDVWDHSIYGADEHNDDYAVVAA